MKGLQEGAIHRGFLHRRLQASDASEPHRSARVEGSGMERVMAGSPVNVMAK